jgi:hypothetical protein
MKFKTNEERKTAESVSGNYRWAPYHTRLKALLICKGNQQHGGAYRHCVHSPLPPDWQNLLANLAVQSRFPRVIQVF